MKNQALLVILMFLLDSTLVCAQKNKVELFFKDGTVLTGLGKLTGDYIKYKPDKKDKPSKYHFALLDHAVIHYDKLPLTYVYLYVNNKKRPRVLEQVIGGEINLYRISSMNRAPFPGGNGGFIGEYTFSTNSYYILRSSDKKATYLGSNTLFSKNFKKEGVKFFKDCPKLIEKIKEETLKLKHIKEIVHFYNQKCKK